MSQRRSLARLTAHADKVLDRVGILANPYLNDLAAGGMTMESFRRTQTQFFWAVTFYPRPMAALVARIPEPQMRLDILRNLIEEHGEFSAQAFHRSTFLRFLRLIGGDTKNVDKLFLWPEVRAFNSVLIAACIHDELEVGVGCMGIIEYAFAGVSQAIANAIVRRGWLSKDRLVHYSLHAAIDKRHAQDFFKVLAPRWDKPERRYYIEQGLELGAYVFDRLYRDLHASGRKPERTQTRNLLPPN